MKSAVYFDKDDPSKRVAYIMDNPKEFKISEIGSLTKIDIQEVELAVERVLHRNGLVNGLPLTADERQKQAIRAALLAGDNAVKILFAKGAGATATVLNDVLDQLRKEFRL